MQVWAAWVPPEATDLDAVAVGLTQVRNPSVLHPCRMRCCVALHLPADTRPCHRWN
jgi:hypothetical protein